MNKASYLACKSSNFESSSLSERNHTVHDTKTQAGMRTIWISDSMSQLLSCVINTQKSGYLFFSSNNNLLTTQQVNYYYTLALKNYDIVDNTILGKVTLHSLRHTFATRCIESGMPPVVLQTLLGHTDIKITMNTYCSISEQYSKEQLSSVTRYLNTHAVQEISNDEEHKES